MRKGSTRHTHLAPKISPLAAGLILCLMILAGPAPAGLAAGNYPVTIAALKDAVRDEARACQTYKAYSQKAYEENYSGIARLFTALATSESIHAANFNTILTDLGSTPPKIPAETMDVGSTRANLKRATEVELQEIDTKYPGILDRLAPEHHEAAMRFITYAWKAEQQHRALIQKIRSATGFFFYLLARRIEDTKADFIVCQYCGSTLTAIPPDVCPICGKPATWYKKIEPPE
jgi:rubrerythrin